jgi:hypothetical protein
VIGGTGEDFEETVILTGMCGIVRDLTPGVIAVVKSSAPTCCFSIVVWDGGFFARIVLDSGAEIWSFNYRSSGGPELCYMFFLYCKIFRTWL